MPLSSRSDRWASRIVILLQFTAWISIGVVLLQKGASTLRNRSVIDVWKMVKTPEESTKRSIDTNAVIPTTTSIDSPSEKTKRTTGEEDFFVRGRSRDRRRQIDEEQDFSDVVESFGAHRQMRLEEKEENKEQNDNEQLAKTNARRQQSNYKDLLKKNHSIIENSLLNSDKNSDVSSIFRSAFRHSFHGDNNTSSLAETEIGNETMNSTSSNDSSTSLDDVAWKKEKLRSRVNTGGAAAAIAMVAIGAAMLVVGPVVIVLRALDKRRQERRFSKASRWDDHPPTYEQATLMGEAPRYSSLNLNVIHEVCVSSEISPIPPPLPSSSSSPSSSPVLNRAR